MIYFTFLQCNIYSICHLYEEGTIRTTKQKPTPGSGLMWSGVTVALHWVGGSVRSSCVHLSQQQKMEQGEVSTPRNLPELGMSVHSAMKASRSVMCMGSWTWCCQRQDTGTGDGGGDAGYSSKTKTSKKKSPSHRGIDIGQTQVVYSSSLVSCPNAWKELTPY